MTSHAGARLRVVLSYVWWPLLLGLALYGVSLAMESGHPFLGFNAVYLSLALTIMLLERVMPHEPLWLKHDGQILPDLAHTIFNKGAVQAVVFTAAAVGVAAPTEPAAGGWWPSDWPLAVQIILGLVLVEFGFYWAHRLGHEWPLLWRVHAVHHSAPRLWVVNTGRFHFLNTFLSAGAAVTVILLFGVPEHLVIWGAAIHAFIGLLTHCNIEMRFGPLSYIFNTPELHRWHHSMDLSEGNKNYGENLPIWDMVFGTYFNPRRRPPAVIGIPDRMPAGFFGQLQAPFRFRRLQTVPAGSRTWVKHIDA